MKIAFLVYEGFTTLDLIGPYEILCRLPDADSCFVAKQKGEIRVDTKAFGIVVDYALADLPTPDVFVIPGGSAGTLAAAQDAEILAWVRGAHEHSRYSTSVCTGSLILGAAGLLKDKKATTHWAAKDLLSQFGATYTEQRVVQQGKIITAAGVSSGIDMALHLARELAGEDVAKCIQLATEYDPAPPFQAGSPAKAGPEIVALARAELQRGF